MPSHKPSELVSENEQHGKTEVAQRSSNEKVRTQSRDHRRHRHDPDHDHDREPFNTVVYPAPAFFDIYPDPTYQGPAYIFTPPLSIGANIQVQIYRAALPNGTGPNAFDFYSNGMSQYLYIPYIQQTSSATTSPPPAAATNIETIGVASSGPPPTLDPSPLYYPTYTFHPSPTVFPTLSMRIGAMTPGGLSAPLQYLPMSNATVDYRNNGQEVILRLNGIPGQATPACYVWRKIVNDYVDSVCPAGYACGPEDLFLQCNC